MNIEDEKSYFDSLLKDLDEVESTENKEFENTLDFDYLMEKVEESRLVNKIHDWVQFTFTFNDLKLIRELFSILKFDLDEIQYHDIKIAGYKSWYEIGPNIRLLVSGEKNKEGDPVNLLEISGNGCRDFEKRGGNYYDLFMFMIKNNAKATRIDSSHDVFTNKWFTMEKLVYFTEKRLFSPARSTKVINGYDRHGKSSGKTIYIGKYDSPMSICIYEKDKEREARSDFDAIQSNVWIRIEVRAKQEHAQTYINEFCLREGDYDNFITEYLYSVLDFKEENSSDERIRRRNTISWWRDFIGFSKKQKFSYKNYKTPDLKVKKNWIKTSVSHALLLLFLAEGDDLFDYLKMIILDKGSELDKTDLVMINEYLESLGYDDKLNMDDCKMKLRLLDNKKY